MKTRKLIQALVLLCSVFVLFSCGKENSCDDKVSEKDINVVYYYNAYYDFFNTIESFSFEELRLENILSDKGANAEYAIRYELNFPEGYVDTKGNVLSGKVNYYSRSEDETAIGNETQFEFDNFEFNGIGAAGSKIMNFSAGAVVDWCTSESGIIFSFNAGTTAFRGCLRKVFSSGYMEVSGSNFLSVNDIEYGMEIIEPIVKQENCSWFNSGELGIKGGKDIRVLKFNEVCEEVEMTLSNSEGCHSVDLKETHKLW